MKRMTAALAVVAVLLSGCSTPPPQNETSNAPDISPALTEAQIKAVVEDLNTVLTNGKAGDQASLESRVMGPALRMRLAALDLEAKSGGQFPAGNLVAETTASTVSAGVKWPRTILDITEVPEGGHTPLLKVIRQDDAHADFRLWAWVRLLPGATVPSTLSAEVGVNDEFVEDSTAQELISNYVQMAPAQVGNAAVEVDDAFTTALTAQVKNLTDSAQASGSVNSTLAAGTDGYVEIPTAEGGSIVVSTLVQTATFQRTAAGSTFTLGGTIGALLGEDKKVTGTVTATWDIAVAFVVPPKGVDRKAHVIGAERILRSVVADASTNPDAAATPAANN
ncbi:MAG: hypothetical protein Q3999_08200 [Buchananella hordeovulneris]|nr:hypothetical protein [Buchananella hordeovulneris]